MKVYFLFPYPLLQAPSQRFRFEQYFDQLEKQGIAYSTQSFFDEATWNILFKKGHTIAKMFGVWKGFWRRFFLLFRLGNYSHVFIQRELTPLGPPVFEWFIAKVLRKKIIFDFDDAIWHSDLHRKQWLKVFLKNPGKTRNIIKWSWKISCGNEYLCDYARQFHDRVVLNPTTIDTETLHNKMKDQQSLPLVIGWTGSHSTLKYLEPLVPVIKKLELRFKFELLVICNKKPDWDLKSLVFRFWDKDSEIDDLMRMNIGLMPLPDDEWAKGKCGFKALQYMALGIPALVSPVGVNAKIVSHGVNGYWCTTPEEWEKYTTLLLEDLALRIQMGKMARIQVVNHYSVNSNTENFVSLFMDLGSSSK